VPFAAPKRGRNLAKSLIKALGTLQSNKMRPFLFQFQGHEHDHKRSVRKEVQTHLGAKCIAPWSLVIITNIKYLTEAVTFKKAHFFGTCLVISSPPFFHLIVLLLLFSFSSQQW